MNSKDNVIYNFTTSLDFLTIEGSVNKKGVVVLEPNFSVNNDTEDLMIKGRDFYAIWLKKENRWSLREQDALNIIDEELYLCAEEHKDKFESGYKILRIKDAKTNKIGLWHKYCQKDMRDNFVSLDHTLVFSNTKTTKKDYSSKSLNYPLKKGPINAYKTLMSKLYSEEERMKIEWAIGAIVSGESKKIQKFLVLYGPGGTGKSTVLNIIQQLFKGYYAVFDAKSIGSSSASFALESLSSNPLVAIQHDGDLSRIEDNTRLNSLVAHEMMLVNAKYKAPYAEQFKSFIFMGTNKPVKITDAKSGLIRRLIDVSPTGEKFPFEEYTNLMNQIEFELGGIAYHCLHVYLNNKNKYDSYIPVNMLGASNDFFNFIFDSYDDFISCSGITGKRAWEMYKVYCEEAKVNYAHSYRAFKEELKNYFSEYYESFHDESGKHLRSWYSGFKKDKFLKRFDTKIEEKNDTWINLSAQHSLLDDILADCPAQYTSQKGTPLKKWDEVDTKLKDISSSELHYVRPPDTHIVIDFDILDENGEKCLKKNVEAASKFPPTYCEVSKGGNGLHLHYIYTGDNLNELSAIYDESIEIKMFTGKSSLRRKLTICNDIPVSEISSGLPLKENKKMFDKNYAFNEKGLITVISQALRKEHHGHTKPEIDFIHKVLNDAYEKDIPYDVQRMKPAVLSFAMHSTNNKQYCLKMYNEMHFVSKDLEEKRPVSYEHDELIFFDIEVYPNLLLIVWKAQGKDKPLVRMINPSSKDVEELMKSKLVGFNCRRYDNHILYSRYIGYNTEKIFNLSKDIVAGVKNSLFKAAYNISYLDVYDMSTKKQSLKKYEIELGIPHKELDIPWDKPVDQSLWDEVAKYCENDVLATEAVFESRKADYTARLMLADLAGMTANDTTNTLTTKIIFGEDRNPQPSFNYRNLSEPVGPERYSEFRKKFGDDYEFRVFNADGLPEYRTYVEGEELPNGWSILPFFPGYTFEGGKSRFLNQDIGEGGRVYAEPGMYGNVWDGDIASQHPNSIWTERLFGERYSRNFYDLVEARIAIKHKDFDKVKRMFGGKLERYLTDEKSANELAYALKIAINSVYGLTSASFENPFRDIRNVDNIVAKRGALFMTILKSEVEKHGYSVCHIKTDSIKIPNPDQNIIDFVMNFGKEYGYTFETEANFERFCLVNDAVYVARENGKWTATGAQFQVPYVFKTIFSKEKLTFDDFCETRAVTSALYLDYNSNLQEGEHDYKFIGKVGKFCPVKKGEYGGNLVRSVANPKDNQKEYASVSGSKGYLWREATDILKDSYEDIVDKSYYELLANKAIETLNNFGDTAWFLSED